MRRSTDLKMDTYVLIETLSILLNNVKKRKRNMLLVELLADSQWAFFLGINGQIIYKANIEYLMLWQL